MGDPKLPARRTPPPTIFKDITPSDQLTPGRAWFGTERGVLDRNRQTVESSTAYYLARQKQSDAYTTLIEARMRIAKKLAELSDLPAVIAEEQHQRDHVRTVAAHRRAMDNLDAAHELHLAVARHELDLAKTREQGVRAQRNLEAARRVADVQVDAWYAQAAAQRNEAEAVKQDTAADLQRTHSGASPDALKAAMADELAKAIATIDNEIELATGRGNAAATLALQNVRARLKSVP